MTSEQLIPAADVATSGDMLIDSLNEVWAELTGPDGAFAWKVEDLAGVPTRVFKSAPPDMRWLWEASAAHGPAEYLVYENERYTYDDAHARVRVLAHWLRNEYGLGRGDRVALYMRNYPEWVLTYWAVASLGAALVGMNAWWTAPELAFALHDCEPEVLVVDSERLERVRSAIVGLDDPPVVVITRTDTTTNDDSTNGPPNDTTTNDDSTNGPPSSTTTNDTSLGRGVLHWDQIVNDTTVADAPASLPPADIDSNDDICIFYTSGTTGSPKGARITHQGSVHNLMHLHFITVCGDLARSRRQPHPEPDSGNSFGITALLPVPLFHVTGCNCLLHPMTVMGGRIVLIHHWDAAEVLRLIEAERVTMITGVPTMARELLQHPDWADTDTSSLASLGGGGAAIQPDLVRRIDQRLPRGRPSTGYGLTETTGISTGISGEYYVSRPDSVGPLMPCMEAKVVDPETGATLTTGQLGELALRGPNIMKGYLNQPEATAEAIVDGWFHTGDIASIDDDGWVYIADRIKDIVIRGGENIHCSEVEAVIYELDEVAEAAVFGVPDDRLGEEVAAALRLRPGTDLDQAGLIAHLEGRIARFKHPKHVWFLEEPLPRNANGKFLKRELRQRLAP